METRLIINLKEGQLEVSGNENFVKQIYEDFKDQIAEPVEKNDSASKTVSKPRKTKKVNKKSNTAHKNKGGAEINNDLDITGLEAYFDQFDPKTVAEKTLIFAKYILEEKEINECTLDDIHTCFYSLKGKIKIPTNYNSLFANDYTRTKYFTRENQNITITVIGENHFSQNMERKTPI